MPVYPRPRPARRVAHLAEAMLASDADLVYAFEPLLRGLTPRQALEVLIAGDRHALWRLRGRTMDDDTLAEVTARELPDHPGAAAMSLVADALRRVVIGETVPTAGLVRYWARWLGLAADRLERAEVTCERVPAA